MLFLKNLVPRSLVGEFQDHILGLLYFLQLKGIVSPMINAKNSELTKVFKLDCSVVVVWALGLEVAPPLSLLNFMGLCRAGCQLSLNGLYQKDELVQYISTVKHSLYLHIRIIQIPVTIHLIFI